MPGCCFHLMVCALLGAFGPVQAVPLPSGQAIVSSPRWTAHWAANDALHLPAELANNCVPAFQGDSASDTQAPTGEPEAPENTSLTFFRHPDTTRYWISGQVNVIYQMHGNFHSAYQGVHSFTAPFEYKASAVGTLMLAYQLNPNPRYETEVIYNEEGSGGRGLSQALGLAGFTNLDVVRNPNLGPTPYMARVEIHQTIGLTDEMVSQSRNSLALATKVPARRFEFRAGKFSLPDILDVNAVLSDVHQQFTNWTIDNSGAWDYAADTRGYTYGADFEYQDKNWGLRYVLALMPTAANGITYDWALRRARAQNLELEIRKGMLPGHGGTLRLLTYGNNAHMGSYREAVNNFLSGMTTVPDIIPTERFGALKYGFDVNAEQDVTANLRLGARFGWNEGQHESFAYTEVDQSIVLGGDYSGTQWGRKQDKIGVALVSNAIKKDHQNYLKLGGLGFLLGDGNLNYAREDILEAYYNAHAWRGLYFALGNSVIAHPGYNKDRGPLDVEGVRVHLEF